MYVCIVYIYIICMCIQICVHEPYNFHILGTLRHLVLIVPIVHKLQVVFGPGVDGCCSLGRCFARGGVHPRATNGLGGSTGGVQRARIRHFVGSEASNMLAHQGTHISIDLRFSSNISRSLLLFTLRSLMRCPFPYMFLTCSVSTSECKTGHGNRKRMQEVGDIDGQRTYIKLTPFHCVPLFPVEAGVSESRLEEAELKLGRLETKRVLTQAMVPGSLGGSTADCWMNLHACWLFFSVQERCFEEPDLQKHIRHIYRFLKQPNSYTHTHTHTQRLHTHTHIIM